MEGGGGGEGDTCQTLMMAPAQQLPRHVSPTEITLGHSVGHVPKRGRPGKHQAWVKEERDIRCESQLRC